MAVHIGTSGWSYDHWENVLYPPKLPAKDRLQHYVEAGVATPILALIPVGRDVRETVRALGPAAG